MDETILNLLSDKTFDFNIDENSYSYNGKPVPRVTKILSRMIANDALMKWANFLGYKHKSYEETLNQAAAIGTEAHQSIENYLQNHIVNESSTPFLAFKDWWENLTKTNSVTIIGEEEPLICEWFGGTYDLLVDINGKKYLIDFKTSNHVSINYFLQLAAYRYMLFKIKGINIDGVIILQLNKTKILFREYLLDFSRDEDYAFIEQCSYTFFSIVNAYYNLEQSCHIFDNHKF